MMKTLSVMAVVLLIAACGEAPDATKAVKDDGAPDGAEIFDMYCTLCHGADGTQGINGAKDLTKSLLSEEEMTAIVTNGRNTMAAYRQVLDAAQIDAVVDHVRSLKKSE
ncbi:MAG: cytochrome c [Flavobacteriales bacterium]|nr:cytochrome c [Flavobacteriales bacterium]